MELSFVFAALKRRWWVVLIFAELGILPLLLGGGPVQSVYEAEARLQVVAPDDSRTSAAQPDRYVLSQIEVLQGREIAEQVAASLGSEDVGAIARSSTFEHIPETDIVVVSVRQSEPERAQLVAQAITEVYINNLVEGEQARRTPELERFSRELDEARIKLADVNERIKTAFAPYLSASADQQRQIPPASVLVPNEEAEQLALLAEITRVEQLQSNLINTPSELNTSIVQNANLPTSQITESSGVFELAFLAGMTLLGIAVALLWARFSPKILDEQHASEILGVPVVTRLKKSKSLKQDPLMAFTRLPQDLISSVDQIAVQAEALATIDRPLTVAVVGSQRGSAATTTAVALASRFAAAEYSVLLVDADRRDPWVTEVFGAGDHGGMAALLGLSDKGVDQIFTRTSEPDVRVLGLSGSGANLRRETAPALVDAAREAADIVIFDAGPLLDAASTVELCNVVDAIVLVVPLSDARADDLAVVARQLSHVRGRVLPVLTATSRNAASHEPVAVNLGADSFAADGGLVATARQAVVAESVPKPDRRERSASERRKSTRESTVNGDSERRTSGSAFDEDKETAPVATAVAARKPAGGSSSKPSAEPSQADTTRETPTRSGESGGNRSGSTPHRPGSPDSP